MTEPEKFIVFGRDLDADPHMAEFVEILAEVSVIRNCREVTGSQVWDVVPEAELAGEALLIRRENFGETEQ